MSSFAGCGLIFYGWKHFPDGISEATEWVCLFLAPIWPVRRLRMRVLTDHDRQDFLHVDDRLPFTVALRDHYLILASLPLSLPAVTKTLAKAYVVLPVILLAPVGVFVSVIGVFRWFGVSFEIGGAMEFVLMGVMAVSILWWIGCLFLVAQILHRSRGASRQRSAVDCRDPSYYRSYRHKGPAKICRRARDEGLSKLEIIRLLRRLYELDLRQAVRVYDQEVAGDNSAKRAFRRLVAFIDNLL
jgi:hypothetical protein